MASLQRKGGSEPIGQIGLLHTRITAQMVRASQATQYSVGDAISNSQTQADVVPITFSNAARFKNGSGRIIEARITLTAASGTVVIPAFDLLLFRPDTDIPFAAAAYAADNTALNISAAAYKQLIGVFAFTDAAWRNQAGGATAAGGHLHQRQSALGTISETMFDLDGLNSASILGLMQAQNTWNPGAVAQTFDFALTIEQD